VEGSRPPIAFSCSLPERLDKQVAANPVRSIGSEQITPGLVQLFRAEVPEIFDLRRETPMFDNEHFILSRPFSGWTHTLLVSGATASPRKRPLTSRLG
jgi:hypothetical protein